MMASQQTKLHDPMYNFDTHFPERLSRLHIHGELNASGSFRRKKGRGQRNGARYKTQPVTFDEIKEVDEEPPTPETADSKPVGTEQLKGQLQAFSRSMDGLLPRTSAAADHHFSHSRSGSRKFHKHPDCIPERVESEQQQTPQKQGKVSPLVPQTSSQRPKSSVDVIAGQGPGPGGSSLPPTGSQATPLASLTPPTDTRGGDSSDGSHTSPMPSPNIAPRRQKITAKAKKRQKAHEEGDAKRAT